MVVTINTYPGLTGLKNYLGRTDLPRGIRNNNPCNIVYNSANEWGGKVPYISNTDYASNPNNIAKHFEQFYYIHWGIRAGMKLIYNYYTQYNLTSLTAIITKYSPEFENDTTGYIANVAGILGINATSKLVLTKETIISLVKAIIYVENGQAAMKYLDDSNFQLAYNKLGITLPSSTSGNAVKLMFLTALIAGGVYYYNTYQNNKIKIHGKRS